jgi:hypothetical protein
MPADAHHPDAFVLLNLAGERKQLKVQVLGASGALFQAYRTSKSERYVSLGEFTARDGVVRYDVPPESATTFYAQERS